jgi:hypothetical protein
MNYDYGDEVLFRAADNAGNAVAKPGAIVGITAVNSEEQVRIHGYPLGTILYSVEFSDGSDALVPEGMIEPLT